MPSLIVVVYELQNLCESIGIHGTCDPYFPLTDITLHCNVMVCKRARDNGFKTTPMCVR
jgi:hypothetical protein